MSNPHRFTLIKKSILAQQQDLLTHLDKINVLINKKENFLKTFEKYMTEYKQKFYTNAPSKKVNFVNQHLFLDQLTKMFEQEQQEVNKLQVQKAEIQQNIMKVFHQIDCIDEHLKQIIQQKKTVKEKEFYNKTAFLLDFDKD